MSLTSELRDPTSPITRYLQVRFPHLGHVQRHWTQATRNARTARPPGRVDYALVGGAFGYRLGFCYRADPPYAAIAGACHYTATRQLIHLAPTFFSSTAHLPVGIGGFLRVLGDHRFQQLPSADPADHAERLFAAEDPSSTSLAALFALIGQLTDATAGQRPDPGDDAETELLKGCYVLAQLERAYRSGQTDPALRDTDLAGLLGQVPSIALADLRRLVEVLAGEGGDALAGLERDGRPVVVAPLLVEHWADGDLIVGSTLVDSKTTKYPEFKPEVFQQVLAYLLLDRNDLYGLDAVGIYLARQGRVVRWPTELLLEATGDPTASLTELREEFAGLLLQLGGQPFADAWVTCQPLTIDPSSTFHDRHQPT